MDLNSKPLSDVEILDAALDSYALFYKGNDGTSYDSEDKSGNNEAENNGYQFENGGNDSFERKCAEITPSGEIILAGENAHENLDELVPQQDINQGKIDLILPEGCEVVGSSLAHVPMISNTNGVPVVENSALMKFFSDDIGGKIYAVVQVGSLITANVPATETIINQPTEQINIMNNNQSNIPIQIVPQPSIITNNLNQSNLSMELGEIIQQDLNDIVNQSNMPVEVVPQTDIIEDNLLNGKSTPVEMAVPVLEMQADQIMPNQNEPIAADIGDVVPKRRRGRPPGSVSKKKKNDGNKRTPCVIPRTRPARVSCIIEGAKPYKCEKCDKAFASKGVYDFHMATHKEESACNLCGAVFEQQDLLEDHMVEHESNGDVQEVSKLHKKQRRRKEGHFKCADCDKNYHSQSSLSTHKRLHQGKGPKCGYCGKTCQSNTALRVHERTHTGEKPYQCDICLTCYTTNSLLQVHKRKVHTGEKPFSCNVCFKSFYNRCNLYTHGLIHSTPRFTCEYCKKGFARKLQLVLHLRLHTGEKPFQCLLCGKAYGRKSALHVHVKTHDTGRPCKCSYCDESFKNPSDLKKHVRIHTGEKRFMCTKCQKTFLYKDTCARHIQQHIGRKYNCSYCGQGFDNSLYFRRHLIIVHRQIPTLLV